MKTSEAARLLPSPHVWLVALFIAAFALRLYHADEPPLNFHATRQYRSLLIARAYYYDMRGSVSTSQAEIARINRERQGILEPPVLEILVATTHWLLGGERFWVPRILSSLFWVAGGAFLYLIARQLVPGRDGPIIAVAYYLFLPFAVVASRSFQPDSLMVAVLVSSIWAFVRVRDSSEPRRLVLAISLAAAALLIKPVAIFLLAAVVVSLELGRGGFRSLLRSPAFGALGASIVPSVLFYGYGMLTWNTLQEQARSSLLPTLVIDRFFWRGWLSNVEDVIGLSTVIVALIGLLVSKPGLPRQLLAGLWIGYVAFCAVFSYHIATHDYYHLQIVPIVALALAPVVAVVVERLAAGRQVPGAGVRVAAIGILGLALLASAMASRSRLIARSGLENRPRIAAEIGGYVAHSTNTVYLSSDYGLPLEFHGELAGRPWPLRSDLEWERLAGMTPMDATQRFSADYARYSPQYFIVADLPEFKRQPDLKDFLAANFRILVANEHYAIFDLR
jgi:Dolichyl-phosphate-mannose-protein mannosyltransferase